MPLSGPFLIFMLIPGIVNGYLFGNILIGIATFIIQFLIAPILTGEMIVSIVSDEAWQSNPGLYAGISNLIVGFVIVFITNYFF